MESLRIVWVWWRDHLLELLPGHAERQQSRARDGLILCDPEGAWIERLAAGDAGPGDAAGGSIAAVERRNGVEQPPVRIALTGEQAETLRSSAARSRLPIVLRLPGTMLLERDVTLPLAAERDLGRVLFHEMDRFTPFSADEVLWSYAPGVRDRIRGRLTTRLSLIQKSAASPLIEALGQAGLPVQSLELEADDGGHRSIPVDHPDEAANRSDRMVRPALALVGVLLLATIFLPFLMQQRSRAELERQIDRYAPAVAEVRRLRSTAAAGATGTEVIAAERRRAGDALEAIALLTQALPDNTYLTGLTYDSGRLTLDGQSKSAASLIAPLTANPRLQDASFTAPVVRNTLGLDSFSLRLRVTR